MKSWLESRAQTEAASRERHCVRARTGEDCEESYKEKCAGNFQLIKVL